MSLHSIYTPLDATTNNTMVEFPRSDVILVGAQVNSTNGLSGTLGVDLGHGLYAYPNINGGILGNGGFNPFLYKISGNSINIQSPQALYGMYNIFYVDDISDLNGNMKRYPPLSKFAGVQGDFGNLSIPESTPVGQPLGTVPTLDFTLNLPNANMSIWGMWLNDFVDGTGPAQNPSDFFIKYPTQNGLPLIYVGSTAYMNLYPYIPMHYYSSAQKLTLEWGYNGGNSSTTATKTVTMSGVFYYDFETVGREIIRNSPFEDYLPIQPAVKKS